MAWIIDNSYPFQDTVGTQMEVFSEPYPAGLMTVNNGEYPRFTHLNTIQMGAFCYAVNLRKVTIPKSVKYIGRYAFRNTALTEVTIASDCTYYPTSFPDNCKINYYDGEETSNFITADGYEIITADGLIFYAKEE